MQQETGATLVTAVNASVWDQGISTRLVTFKDWAWKDSKLISTAMIGIQKLDGRSGADAIEHVCAFTVGQV